MLQKHRGRERSGAAEGALWAESPCETERGSSGQCLSVLEAATAHTYGISAEASSALPINFFFPCTKPPFPFISRRKRSSESEHGKSHCKGDWHVNGVLFEEDATASVKSPETTEQITLLQTDKSPNPELEWLQDHTT